MKKYFKAIVLTLVLCVIVSLGIVPAFAEDDVTHVYNKTWDIYYATLEDALDEADPDDEIYIVGEYELTTSLTIDSDVTVIVASSDSLNDTVTGGSNISGYAPKGSVHSKLIIPENITLTVDGTLLVAGNQEASQPESGCLTGSYGLLELNGDIIVNGKLYARGEISGDGVVTANNGSEVYQLFQLHDWRGGTATNTAYNVNVFPFNLYEISNIQTTAEYNYGSALYGQYYTRVSIWGISIPSYCNVELLGTNGILSFTSSVTDVTMTYNRSTNRVKAIVNGDVSTGDINVSFWAGSTTWIDSTNLILPFGYNMDVEIADDSSLTVTNSIKLLPGCIIDNDGDLIIDSGAALYLYNGSNYLGSYNFANWSNSSSDAQVTGAGTVTVNGTFAESTDVTSALNVKEYIQSTNSTENVPFVAIITIV